MEVVLAIGVVAFAFVAILGLLPTGMTQFRQAIDTTVCAQIAQRVIGDAQQTDFDTLIDKSNLPGTANYSFRGPAVNNPQFRYFDERGGEVIPSTKNAQSKPEALSPEEKALIVYHVNVRVIPETAIPKTNSGGDAPQLATVTLQVANNPGNAKIVVSSAAQASDDPTRQLWVKTPGVTFLTYSALVARNQ